MLSQRAPARRRLQRGLSIVETMVGITIGLIIVAGASLLVSGQLTESRRLLSETQLQQDLRAAADIMARDLRRAGYWDLARSAAWQPGSAAVENPYFLSMAPTSGTGTEVTYSYRRTGSENAFGFRLDSETNAAGNTVGVLKTLLGVNWQPLTDLNAIDVTAFTVTAQASPAVPVKLPCLNLCPDGTQDCWPEVIVHDYTIDISARGVADPTLQRSVRGTVRLRNDQVKFNGASMCPA